MRRRSCLNFHAMFARSAKSMPSRFHFLLSFGISASSSRYHFLICLRLFLQSWVPPILKRQTSTAKRSFRFSIRRITLSSHGFESPRASASLLRKEGAVVICRETQSIRLRLCRRSAFGTPFVVGLPSERDTAIYSVAGNLTG